MQEVRQSKNTDVEETLRKSRVRKSNMNGKKSYQLSWKLLLLLSSA